MTYKLNEKLKEPELYNIVTENYRIKLDANESFVNTGELLNAKIMKALENVQLNRYPDDSYSELRKAFGGYYDVGPDSIVAGNGSDELISVIIGSFLKSDDSLLLCDPDFSMYKIFATAFERKVFYHNRLGNGDLDVNGILREVNENKINAVILSNPSAAYSTVTPREDILKLIDNTDSLVVIDEAYMDFSDQSVLDATSKKDNLIVLKTCSKGLGLAGIRLGFAIASEKLANIINALRPPYNVSSLTAAVGRTVLKEKKFVLETIESIKVNRDELYKDLKALNSPIIKGVYTSATNYICIESDYGDQIYEMLKAQSILIRIFPGRLRITVGSKEENSVLVETMHNIIKTLEQNKQLY